MPREIITIDEDWAAMDDLLLEAERMAPNYSDLSKLGNLEPVFVEKVLAVIKTRPDPQAMMSRYLPFTTKYFSKLVAVAYNGKSIGEDLAEVAACAYEFDSAAASFYEKQNTHTAGVAHLYGYAARYALDLSQYYYFYDAEEDSRRWDTKFEAAAQKSIEIAEQVDLYESFQAYMNSGVGNLKIAETGFSDIDLTKYSQLINIGGLHRTSHYLRHIATGIDHVWRAFVVLNSEQGMGKERLIKLHSDTGYEYNKAKAFFADTLAKAAYLVAFTNNIPVLQVHNSWGNRINTAKLPDFWRSPLLMTKIFAMIEIITHINGADELLEENILNNAYTTAKKFNDIALAIATSLEISGSNAFHQAIADSRLERQRFFSDCAGLISSINEMSPNPEIRFTLNRTMKYVSLTGIGIDENGKDEFPWEIVVGNRIKHLLGKDANQMDTQSRTSKVKRRLKRKK